MHKKIESTKEEWSQKCQEYNNEQDDEEDEDGEENEYLESPGLDTRGEGRKEERENEISQKVLELFDDEEEVNNLVNSLQDQIQQIVTKYSADIFNRRIKADEKMINSNF